MRLRVFRGQPGAVIGEVEYSVTAEPGMVVLDAIRQIQRRYDSSLACRWNCKAARCGSCGAEINGRPALLCKTRLDSLPPGPVTVHPMRAFPLVRDLVSDLSCNYRMGRTIAPFTSGETGAHQLWRIQPADLERLHELRRCIECFLCQDVCHVLREHRLGERFVGPRHLVRAAALEMHPRDRGDRIGALTGPGGLGYCNVTRCCSEVCPERIRITDNAIIPLKERAADRRWDPLRLVARRLLRRPGAAP